ncbi:zinc finger, BED-type, Phospholipase-like, Homeodomain-like protein [Artemisia annua]|uniref:Zinc finger, BED-type, Phospholipase-like, Homeodomain-like protein n=1 Tax=Artemisia annua TaxID=35608 RepID=A0A2U1N6P3_ARTAN|nr:zinc finger, BED-type, Phospholipase-like, Homeodomain-like protein [Artemisia annua]
MSRRNQASQSQPTSSNNAASQAQGSTNQPFEVSIEKTTRNQEIWCHFDLVKFSDGSKKARCKACNTYISSSGNSTLKKHTNNHCKATKGVSGSDQNVMGRDGSSLARRSGVYKESREEVVQKIIIRLTSNKYKSTTMWERARCQICGASATNVDLDFDLFSSLRIRSGNRLGVRINSKNMEIYGNTIG